MFLCLPRSTYSELEKRDLATFPEFSPEKLKGAQYTNEVSHWFSDTEPYRDVFMSFSMGLRDKMRMSFGSDEDAISFHSVDNSIGAPGEDAAAADIEEYQNKVTANENAKIASAGIMLIGKVPNVMALNAFGGEATGGTLFANAVSQYAKELPGVKVYAMIIPLSSEFYTPDRAKKRTKPQLPVIQNVYKHLTGGARGVNAYSALANHVNEPIYLRTDHHWAPLGAYYAAEAFAKSAGVPFKDLSTYDKRVVKGYVGSMYGFSKDISVKNSPEDFVYYVPKGVSYETIYRDYKVNKDYQVTSEGAPVKGSFFYQYKDGSGGAYCTFMGGDQRLTHVRTNIGNGRRLLIIKDSYGNPVPSFLFHSFEDIYVVDFRYFTRNIKKFIKDNKVTDVLFAMNIFNAYSASAPEKIKRFLTQGDNSFASPTVEKKESDKGKSAQGADQKKPEIRENEKQSESAPSKVAPTETEGPNNSDKKPEKNQSSANEGGTPSGSSSE